MENIVKQKNMPSRILYSMIRIKDIDRSVSFYQEQLGMQEIKREHFSEGQFSLVFMGYGDESDVMLELTYNWDKSQYQHGSAYGHLALGVEKLDPFMKQLKLGNTSIIREAGPMSFANDETGHRENIAFILDPDGYKIELIEIKNIL